MGHLSLAVFAHPFSMGKNGHYAITEKELSRPFYSGAVASVKTFILLSSSGTATFLPGVFLSYDSDLQFR